MRVKELLEILATADPESLVVVHGYERGVTTANSAYEVEIALDVNKAWYYGEHEELCDDEDYPGKTRAMAIRIG